MYLKKLGYCTAVAIAAVGLVLGSAGSSEAKSKKKAAAPAAVGGICIGSYKPVCAVKGGMKFTYANGCYAVNDGAKVVSDKACPVKKAKAKKAKKAKAKKAAKKPATKKKM